MPDLLALNGQIIGGVPLPGENYVKLWENPDPTAAFESQYIDLLSDDYDFLLCISKIYINVGTQSSVIASKGNIFQLIFSDDGSVETRTRKFDYVSDTRLSVGDAYANGTKNNNYCIPVAIYGIKKDALAAGSGGSGGHIIENADGTDLDQQNTLQFKGTLRATNDAQNGKTIVDDSAVEIDWDDWQAMTEQEREAYLAENPKVDIIGFPDADADLQLDFMTKLWENPDSTQAFAAQDVTLSSDDYEFLLFIFRFSTGGNYATSTLVVPKGLSAYADYAYPSTAGSRNFARFIGYLSDTSYNISVCTYSTGSTGTTTENANLVPIAIYGFKKKITVTVDAIAKDVSTSASKCMLEDGETSVEDAITTNNAGTRVDIKSYTSSTNPFIVPSDGYIEANAANNSGTSGIIQLRGSDDSLIGFIGADYPNIVTTYVRKGMKAFTQTATTNMAMTYIPLI